MEDSSNDEKIDDPKDIDFVDIGKEVDRMHAEILLMKIRAKKENTFAPVAARYLDSTSNCLTNQQRLRISHSIQHLNMLMDELQYTEEEFTALSKLRVLIPTAILCKEVHGDYTVDRNEVSDLFKTFKTATDRIRDRANEISEAHMGIKYACLGCMSEEHFTMLCCVEQTS